jgi:hypothetical protein
MIGQRQKFLMHHYPRVAGLSQATYHRVLLSCAGVRSAADRAMSQDGFERCMAAFETMLAERVAQGQVPSPVGRDRWILSLFYWRRKVPADGCANSRQVYRIRQMWDLLSDSLPHSHRTHDYLHRIITRCIGQSAPKDLCALSTAQAGWVMDALADRLAYAYKEGGGDAPADGFGLHRVFGPAEAAHAGAVG